MSENNHPTEKSEPALRRAWAVVPLGFQAIFYFGALAWLVVISFTKIAIIDQPRWEFTFDNYASLLSDSASWEAILRAIGFSFLNVVIALVIAIPASCALVIGCARRWVIVMLYVLLVPFFTNYFVRMVGWQGWLSSNGILGWLAAMVGYDGGGLLYTPAGAVIGLQSILIPLATLLLFIAADRLDPEIFEAARNLGATRRDIILHLLTPAMKPAIWAAAFSCFILSFSDFVCVRMLAGNRFYTASSLLTERIMIQDWGAVTTLSCLILILALAGLTVTGFQMSRSFKA